MAARSIPPTARYGLFVCESAGMTGLEADRGVRVGGRLDRGRRLDLGRAKFDTSVAKS